MKRRSFLHAALVGGAGLAAGCDGPQPRERPEGAASVHTGNKVIWRLASSFPRSLDTLYGGAEDLAARVSAMTDGQFSIRCYSGGELVPGLQVLDAVQQGTVQCGQSASYYYIGKNPALAFDACVPFGMTARQKTSWLIEGGGLDLMNRVFADFGVRTFPAGNTGVQMGGWFKREVNSLQDLSGLKMRIPGMGGKVMAELGVSVQNIAGGEIFQALERGAIDATEWVGPYDDLKLGFHKAAKYYYYPGWWEPGPNLSFYVNEAAWASLPAAFKEVFIAASRDAGLTMQARYDTRNPPALQELLASGVDMRPFPEDLLQAAKDTSQQLLEDTAAGDPEYRRVYETWKTARDTGNQWFGASELAYARFAWK
jgi:TRAP-type mannitol/chloroaromatic compound transport system substrate-binding protein